MLNSKANFAGDFGGAASDVVEASPVFAQQFPQLQQQQQQNQGCPEMRAVQMQQQLQQQSQL